MRRALVLAVLMCGFVTAAEALTIRDVIELTRAGLGEEVLLALIEVDRGVYAIDPATLKKLKEAGVSERVIVALVRSGRERVEPEPMPVEPPSEPASAPEPQVIVIEHQRPEVEQVMVPVPIYIPVASPGRPRIYRNQPVQPGTDTYSTFIPFQSAPPLLHPQPVRSEPIYWGHGGKLRPDAWGQPRPADRDTPRGPSKDSRDKK